MSLNFQQKTILRKQFQSDVYRFFGRPISIGERTFRHVELSYELMSTRTEDRGNIFLTKTAKSYPALLLAIDRIGITKEMLQDTNFTPEPHLLEMFIRRNSSSFRALTHSFYNQGKEDLGLVKVAQEIASNGELRMEDMLIGPLEGEHTQWGLTKQIINSLISKARNSGSNAESASSLYLRLTHELRLIREIDASASEQQFVLSFDGKGYRLQPFGAWGAHLLEESPLADGSKWIARGNVLEPINESTSISNDSLVHLEDLINTGAQEADFQRFFEEHPHYVLMLGPYTSLHPQVILTEDDGSRLIPDFFLEKINSDFCDICDLKRPTAQLIRYQRNRFRFRDAVMEAVAQLETYRDWFEDSHRRAQFYQRYGLKAYRPKVVVIIGRRNSYYQDVDRIRLESRLPQWVKLNTYDDVVDRARQWLRFARGADEISTRGYLVKK